MRSRPNKAMDVVPCQNFNILLSGDQLLSSAPSSPVVHVVLFGCPGRPTQLPPLSLPPEHGARPPPLLLSAEHGVTAHIPRRSPTDCEAIPPAFEPPPPPLAFWRSSRLARSAVSRSAVNLYPVRTDPRYSARSPPPPAAPSCLPSC